MRLAYAVWSSSLVGSERHRGRCLVGASAQHVSGQQMVGTERQLGEEAAPLAAHIAASNLRRGLPQRGHPNPPLASARAESERGATRRHRPPRVPRPTADRQPTPPRTRSADVHRPIQRPSAPPVARSAPTRPAQPPSHDHQATRRTFTAETASAGSEGHSRILPTLAKACSTAASENWTPQAGQRALVVGYSRTGTHDDTQRARPTLHPS
jgi:hypothetical protein